MDIQWGNHDVLWMGAAAGQRGCIANVIRICARYGNLDILEDGYGINLLPLASFAMDTYGEDPCTCFALKGRGGATVREREMETGRCTRRSPLYSSRRRDRSSGRTPEFKLEKRNLLHHIDFESGAIEMEGKHYELLDKNFPTVDPEHPYAFSPEEADIMDRLEKAFLNCEKLQAAHAFPAEQRQTLQSLQPEPSLSRMRAL